MSIEFINHGEHKNHFSEIFGLEATKRRLNFYINNYVGSKRFPNICLASSRGCGKTSLARLISKGLNKKHIEINCASLTGVSDFFDIVNQHLIDCDAVLFLDEAEAINEQLSLALCTILNPTKENVTKYTFNGGDYTFRFDRLHFVFSTTETYKIHHALLDRLNVIDLDSYTNEHLKLIIQYNLKEIKIEDGLLDRIVRIVRSNPRQATKLSNDILAFLKSKGKSELSKLDWLEFFNELGLYDLGLTSSEVRLLTTLKQYPNSSLTRLATMLNNTTDNCRKYVEQYPLRLGLLEIHAASGRRLSQSGYEFVAALENKESKMVEIS